jgi:hypothetical protein
MNELQKVLHVGRGEVGEVFCKVTFADGRLSIHGVEGPKANGDCTGSCGQITDTVAEVEKFAPGWNASLRDQFVAVWNRWHLNDMRAGCEHQREVDTARKVEVVSYKLTHAAIQLRDATLRAASRAALKGETFTPDATARALAELEKWYSDIYTPPDADSPLSGCYEVAKREQKAIGWVYPSEHPDGMLTRPCEVCGYKYGSAWLKEEVPVEVIEFLRGLPDADITPAWV